MNFEAVFRQSFVPLQQVFGHTLTHEVLAIYANHLSKRLTAEQFAKACIHVIDNFRPTAACRFPTPAHFVEFATGSVEERATNAVSRVMAASKRVGPNTSVTFGDKALHRAIERFGGWEEMRDFDWQFREANFKKVYAAEVNAGDNFGPDYLEGVHERTNRLTAHTWTHGQPRPNLIAHIGEHGEEFARLPPPKVEVPKEITSSESVSDTVQDLARKMGGV
jgi:hypothetical protein